MRCCLLILLLLLSFSSNIAAMELSKADVHKLVQLVRKNAYEPYVDTYEISSKSSVTPRDVEYFLHSFDKWATFLDEHTRFSIEGIREANFGSLGMAILKNKAHELVCIPYPKSPAARAGVKEGDVLLNVDGMSMTGSSMKSVSALLAGEPNTLTHLTLRRNERYINVEVVRKKVKIPHVTFTQEQGFARIRIWYFEKNTPGLLRKALQRVKSQPLVLDVRGNSGGSIASALQCASVFLPKNVTISITRQNPTKNGRADARKITKNNGSFIDIFPLYIWQDSLTASAAEALTAALIDNERAINIGQRSFGKSYVQERFFIRKHILTLSVEALFRPNEISWEHEGIEPIYFKRNVSTENLVRVMQEII